MFRGGRRYERINVFRNGMVGRDFLERQDTLISEIKEVLKDCCTKPFRETFIKEHHLSVDESKLYENQLITVRDRANVMLGYCALRIYRYQVRAQHYAVSSPSMYMKKSARGKNEFSSYVIRSLISFNLRYFFKNIKVFIFFASATSTPYYLYCRNSYVLYPSPRYPTLDHFPADCAELYRTVRDAEYGEFRSGEEEESEFTVDLGSVYGCVEESVSNKKYQDHRANRFYSKNNKNQAEGFALLVLAPTGLIHLLYAVVVSSKNAVVKSLRCSGCCSRRVSGDDDEQEAVLVGTAREGHPEEDLEPLVTRPVMASV